MKLGEHDRLYLIADATVGGVSLRRAVAKAVRVKSNENVTERGVRTLHSLV